MFDFTIFRGEALRGFIRAKLSSFTTTAEVYDGDKLVIPSFYTEAVGFDTESSTTWKTRTEKRKDKDGNVYTIEVDDVDECFCYSYQVAFGRDAYAIYRTEEAFFEFLYALDDALKERDAEGYRAAKIIIWVANLAHEFAFIKYRLFEAFEIKKAFAKSPRDVIFIDCGRFEFRECLGLFGRSLAEVAKNWTTTQKAVGDLDYNLIRTSCTPLTATERGYCINDVIILAEMHAAICKHYIQSNGALVIPYTSAGFVRLKLKQYIDADEATTEARENNARSFVKGKPRKRNIDYIKWENRRLYVDALQWALCRQYGYSGGLCGSNIDYAGKTLHNVECVDLTSDYPAQFAHRYYPAGSLRKVSRRRWPDLYRAGKRNEKSYLCVFHIDELKSKTHHATLSKHKILNMEDVFAEQYGATRETVVYNGKIRRAKNLVVIWNEVDLDAYEKIYDIKGLSPLVIWEFGKRAKLPKWWLDAMADDYETKARLKQTGQSKTPEYRQAKTNANTYYGVAATKQGDTFDEFCEGIFAPSEEFSFDKMRFNTWLNPYFAFWCTSYARAILMDFISRFPDLIVQYDTDSLYYRKDGDAKQVAELQKAIADYNEEQSRINKRVFADRENAALFDDLGAWDFDETFTDFLPLGAKKYIKRDKDGEISTVIAGLPKSAIPSKIVKEGIEKPFDYFNPLKKWLDEDFADVVIEHAFAHKFASVYNDDRETRKVYITDYLGNTTWQKVGSYHALKPIDFTLSMGVEYLSHILGGK